MSQNTIIQTVNEIANHARQHGIAHLNTQDIILKGNVITIEDIKTVHFGSCSYLGLEFNQTVKNAAKQAIDAYGTQFSSSRAYLSSIHYQQLETKLEKIFGAPTIVTPTTTLGHIAAIPVLISPKDAVILDHQVHNSVQTATGLVKAKGTHVELLRHNRMDLLEKRIIALKEKHEKIWYMADGIYSMFGDATPVNEIYTLLDKYPEFHFYVDDAHAMSCFGKNGRGFVLAEREIHKRMIVATSLNKAYASGGGALIFPNRETAQLIRNVGGPLITSGPMQPSALGAANAVADIHLNGEIEKYQEDLQENIKYAHLMLKKYGLPNLAESFSPIFFIAVSLPKIAYSIINKMKDDGFFMNIGIFPAVPIKNTGVRFTITRLHTFEQIDAMTKRMAHHFFNTIKEEAVDLRQIFKAFKIPLPEDQKVDDKVDHLIKYSNLKVQHFSSISQIPVEDWNHMFSHRGTYDTNGMQVLEKSFTGNHSKYMNWSFDYLMIKDFDGNLVLGTFLTTSISKDDMLANREVSLEIESKRQTNPDFMTSKTLQIGSPITEGNHIYLDRNSSCWKQSLDILFDKISELQEREEVNSTIIRDLPVDDPEMDNYMMSNGFFKINMPDNLIVSDINWNSEDEYYGQLSKKNKAHYRRNIRRHIDQFEINVNQNPTDKEIEIYYDLYLNVKSRSLDLNTFNLPIKLFKNIANNESWEVLSLYLKPNGSDILEKQLAAIVICHKGTKKFSGLIAGINYKYNSTYQCYRQMLASIIRRGSELGYKEVSMGYTSTIEKKHLGAKIHKSCAYMQIKDNFNLEAIEAMTTTKKTKDGIDKSRILPI